MGELILIRGAPGSGKSTLAKTFAYDIRVKGFAAVNIETDQYFIRPDGYYDFNPRLLGKAHAWAQERARVNIQYITDYKCDDGIIVSNTFTRLWEMKPYLDMAEEFGVPVTVYRCSGEYQNIHGVPDDKVRMMRERMEPFEGEIFV